MVCAGKPEKAVTLCIRWTTMLPCLQRPNCGLGSRSREARRSDEQPSLGCRKVGTANRGKAVARSSRDPEKTQRRPRFGGLSPSSSNLLPASPQFSPKGAHITGPIASSAALHWGKATDWPRSVCRYLPPICSGSCAIRWRRITSWCGRSARTEALWARPYQRTRMRLAYWNAGQSPAV